MLAVALLMGAVSGFLIQVMATLLFAAANERLGPVPVLLVFLAGWATSTWALSRDAVSVSRVFSRGFLLGAAEWLLMILVGIIYAGGAVAQASDGSSAGAAGATIGGGLVVMMTGGVSIAMAVFCLIGFAVSHSLGKEMRRELPERTPTRKCPACAELVQQEALKCRYCGEALSAEKAA